MAASRTEGMAEDRKEDAVEGHMAKEAEVEGVAVSTIFSSRGGRYWPGFVNARCTRHRPMESMPFLVAFLQLPAVFLGSFAAFSKTLIWT